MWQNQKSLLCGGLLTGAAIVLSLQVRPYGLLFSMLLAFWLYRTRCANFMLVAPPSLKNYGEKWYKDYLEFKETQPRLCWMYSSTVLLIIALLGHIVSGKTIIVFGFLLAAVIFSKHKVTIIRVQPEVNTPIWSSQTTELDEFLPDVDESNLSLLQHASDEAGIPHSRSSPSNDNGNDDSCDDDIPDLISATDLLRAINEQTDSSDDDCLISPAVALSTHEQSPTEELEFNRRYFNNTSSSSSSDDDSITKGLVFHDNSIIDGVHRLTDNVTENESSNNPETAVSSTSALLTFLSNLSGNNVFTSDSNIEIEKSKNLPKGPDKPGTTSLSSDESEFEIITMDELNI